MRPVGRGHDHQVQPEAGTCRQQVGHGVDHRDVGVSGSGPLAALGVGRDHGGQLHALGGGDQRGVKILARVTVAHQPHTDTVGHRQTLSRGAHLHDDVTATR
jgi:hypothetical protein